MIHPTDDLVSWFRSQIDEDERIAIAAADDPDLEGIGNDWFVHRGEVRVDDLPHPDTATRVAALGTVAMMTHIARHDPTRARNQVAANRRILDIHQPTSPTFGDCVTCCGEETYDEDSDGDAYRYRETVPFPCPTMRAALLAYADRPGYQEAWRPE